MLQSHLEEEISAFHRLLPGLRAGRQVGWVVIFGQELKGNFRTFEEAAAFALEAFPTGDFLIRHTDAAMPQVPFVVLDS
jgi:hypothetical protein